MLRELRALQQNRRWIANTSDTDVLPVFSDKPDEQLNLRRHTVMVENV